tara:strand:- start:6587 stop:7012 length:426 start_codon:yes stop_codon:yes gene_type:complete
MPVVTGTAYWASVLTPNTNYEPVYTVNLVVPDDVAKTFKDNGFTIKEMNEGPAVIIKRKVNGPKGMIRQAPELLDKNKQPINVNVGNGSTVRVLYKEWSSEYKGTLFKGLDFCKMQVIDLVEFGGVDDDFDVIDDEEIDDL